MLKLSSLPQVEFVNRRLYTSNSEFGIFMLLEIGYAANFGFTDDRTRRQEIQVQIPRFRKSSVKTADAVLIYI